MKSLAVIAVLVAGCALPACAQRVASHGGSVGTRGGFSSHGGAVRGPVGAPAFRGGSAPAVRLSYAGSRNLNVAPLYRGGIPGGGIPGGGIAGGYRRPVHPLHRYGNAYGGGVPYVGSAWLTPYELGYPDTSAYDGPMQAPEPDASQPMVDSQGQPQAAVPYPAYVAPPSRPAPPAEPEEAVTLIFKDGRAPEQIHNYMLTRTTLYVRDQHKRDIAVADLDLEATAKANRDAGVDFELPASK